MNAKDIKRENSNLMQGAEPMRTEGIPNASDQNLPNYLPQPFLEENRYLQSKKIF